MGDQRPVPMNDPAWGKAWVQFQAIMATTSDLESEAFTFGELCFMAGWAAREQAPNTLIIDTTDARMVPIDNSAAAPAPLIDNRIGPNFGKPKIR